MVRAPSDERRLSPAAGAIYRSYMNPLLTLSGVELAEKIRTRATSSLEVVQAHIDHIEAVNPTLNAVVAERFDAAKAEARTADERVAQASDPATLPVFHGVPCTIKESFELTGMPNSSGLLSRKDTLAREDAITVQRMRKSGCIPLGVTNTSELCMWMESNNPVYGRSNNPYDPRHIVGGSSGGEGAIVGSGGSPFGLGADIGGSIRMPAFFNGVFGHKPSGCLVPNSGQYPNAENEAQAYLCSGPITRRAADLMPLLRIMAGPNAEDPHCRAMDLGDPAEVDVGSLTVLSVAGNGAVRVSSDLAAAQENALRTLEASGATVRRLEIPGLRKSIDIWSAMMSAAADTPYEAILGAGQPVYPLVELLRWLVGRSRYTLPSIGLVAIERILKRFGGRVERFIELGRQLKAELDGMLGPRVVMLYPSYASPAPRHHRPLLPPTRWQYTSIINVMQLPSTQVPLGLNDDGLPLGVQVVGAHGHDHVSIAVALHLEAQLGGWVFPPRLMTP